MKIYILLLSSFVLFKASVTGQDLLLKKELISLEASPKYSAICERFPYVENLNFYEITYLSDSLKVNGHLITPKKEGVYPGIVYNRGGNRDFGMNNTMKLIGTGLAELASEGYVIALSQYRGNGGSEGTEEFGGADVDDVLNLIDVMAEMPEVDTSRLGMYGWSRGGMMTYRALVATNQIKAVIVGGGCSDLTQLLEFRPEFEEGVYEELIPNYTQNKTEELDKRSAIKWVDKFPSNVPILLLHGGSDGNVSPKQALELSIEFNEYRIPHKLIIYEGDNHGIVNHRDEVMTEVKSWFKRYLVDGEDLPDMKYRVSN